MTILMDKMLSIMIADRDTVRNSCEAHSTNA